MEVIFLMLEGAYYVMAMRQVMFSLALQDIQYRGLPRSAFQLSSFILSTLHSVF